MDQKYITLPEAIDRELEILQHKIYEEKKTWLLLVIVNLTYNILMYNKLSWLITLIIILALTLFNIGITYYINQNLKKINLLINIGIKERFKDKEIKSKYTLMTRFNQCSLLLLIINICYLFKVL